MKVAIINNNDLVKFMTGYTGHVEGKIKFKKLKETFDKVIFISNEKSPFNEILKQNGIEIILYQKETDIPYAVGALCMKYQQEEVYVYQAYTPCYDQIPIYSFQQLPIVWEKTPKDYIGGRAFCLI